MPDVIRIKRRASPGSPGAPSSLANAEMAYNENDHTLYIGEGTGGAGGSATVIVPIGGNGVGSNLSPLMNGVAAVGTAIAWARGDHVHPTDTSRAPLLSPVFTGTPSLPTGTIGVTQNPGTNDITLATTAFVQSAVSAVVAGVSSFNNRSGAVVLLAADVTGVGGALLASPIFTGTPQAPTATNGTNTTQIASTAFVLATRLDQLASPTADVSLNGRKLINVSDPTSPQDAANKNYVDLNIQGLDTKSSVRAATTDNITLSGTQTIDGVTLAANDRVLVKDQATQAANGIYIVAAGAWARSTDADSWNELVSAYVFVESGSTNADSGWTCTADPGGTLGTTNVVWTQFSGAGQVIAGAGLTKTGNTLDIIGTSARIMVNNDSIDIDAAYVGQTSITTLGTIGTGTWNAGTIGVNRGGTGATALTGYVKGSGTNPLTASATIPNTDVTGLGTMSTQNASAVNITGGVIDGVTLDGGVF